MLKKYKTHLLIAVAAALVLLVLAFALLPRLVRGSGHPDRYLLFGKWDRQSMTEGGKELLFVPDCQRTPIRQFPEGAQVLLKNTGTEVVHYSDESWAMEVLLGDTWYGVPGAGMYNSGAVMDGILPGEEKTHGFSMATLERLYNWSALPAGTYRLRWLGCEFPLTKTKSPRQGFGYLWQDWILPILLPLLLWAAFTLLLLPRLLRGGGHPARHLLFGRRWDRLTLKRAPADLPGPDCDRMLLSQPPEDPEVLLEGRPGGQILYDPAWTLEVRLGGLWYTVPDCAERTGSAEPAALGPGQRRTHRLTMARIRAEYNWDALPSGTYRLRWLGYEFPLEK